MRKTPFAIPVAALAAYLVLACGCGGDKAAVTAEADDDHDHGAEAAAKMTLTPQAVAAAGIRTEPAAARPLARTVVAAGELEWNARRVVHLTARAAGRLERVLAVRGDRVREGQLLAELYSPDFLARQAEFLQAAARLARRAGDPAEEGPARALLAGARDRLRVLGLPETEIDALAAAGAPRPLLAVRAPLSGTVLESGIVTGDAAELGTSLFRLADPSTVWACLHIQERDLADVRPGAEAVLRVQAYPGEEFRGRLAFVGDAVDAATRTVEGRIELANPAGRLKPGMFVEATIATAGDRRALAVPESAVQDDAGRAIVFVRTGEATFVRRAVRTGERAGGFVEVLEGLAEGEAVAVSGGFLLKSEFHKESMRDDHGHD
ncbi:MAG: efflux RND transporter periplasmic adaptor subunit [Candidatus Aminicenantes bacterium]|nr:efflux RND transporter periplasmic adaptor subunit [Candidatus Aminicenantes bacterium]